MLHSSPHSHSEGVKLKSKPKTLSMCVWGVLAKSNSLDYGLFTSSVDYMAHMKGSKGSKPLHPGHPSSFLTLPTLTPSSEKCRTFWSQSYQKQVVSSHSSVSQAGNRSFWHWSGVSGREQCRIYVENEHLASRARTSNKISWVLDTQTITSKTDQDSQKYISLWAILHTGINYCNNQVV